MSLLDHHAKNLLPTVWSPDGDLLLSFRAQLDEQMDRFPDTKDILLVGDAVSHYWEHDSDVDVLLLTPPDSLPEAHQQAVRVSGFPLEDTRNSVRFWPVKTDFSPYVLAKHFGPVYSVNTGRWYGEHVQDETELTRVAGVLQHVNWRLWRAKNDEELFPYEWRVLSKAFSGLSADDRERVLGKLRYREQQIDRNVTQLLKRQPRDLWRAAERFDQTLYETEELPSDAHTLPHKVVLALLHRFRYQTLLEMLTDVDERMQINNKHYAANKDTDDEPSSLRMLRTRLLQLSEMILQRLGGSANAVDVIYKLFKFILENNRYVLTDMRRRRIVYRLYKRYYMGKEDPS